ncbi:truncated hemoglobin YjbI [Thermocatellispora tengchongensis]|uniref:Truncated hemoglobin YjbI n=1 Tax=Thermocatellispora tengchongensis TaxID=1073253 RepID=A0A840P476_9ACTN|nr:group II truncated hemoglobin [Thermocatellispora tengchongensis]MBB5133799.1 truncated hemoglobin YjbI [Thermocatellispora tengchongensis]
MIVELIRYDVPEDRRPAFEESLAAELRRSADCADYELLRAGDGHCLLRVKWVTDAGPAWTFAEEHITSRARYTSTRVAGQGGSVPTLYEWAGGAEAFERLTEVFYGHVKRDEVVGPLFAHMDPGHPRYVAMWLSEVFGGPDRYSRERGGYAHMLAQHLGKAITERQRRRWVSLLMDAADEVGLPSDPEFRAAFAGYIEWGTRLALSNSQPDATPVQQAPVPRWGWGVAPPYVP